MNDPINVLIVEDELLTINSFKKALEQLSNSEGTLNFKIRTARDCHTASLEIDKAVKATPFDLVLLNINIPPSRERRSIIHGEDIGLELKGYFPKVKIMVFTSNNENYKLNNIIRTLDPDGFIIKRDIDSKELIKAIRTVLLKPPYYSKEILKLLRQLISNDFVLDKIDRALLYNLSKGIKNKNLPDHIYLSKGGIERRKRHLREVFNIVNEDDKTLLECAKEKGYL